MTYARVEVIKKKMREKTIDWTNNKKKYVKLTHTHTHTRSACSFSAYRIIWYVSCNEMEQSVATMRCFRIFSICLAEKFMEWMAKEPKWNMGSGRGKWNEMKNDKYFILYYIIYYIHIYHKMILQFCTSTTKFYGIRFF